MGKRKKLERSSKERLLEAAGEIFAEKGYRYATIPEICKKAGANVASVNYYFGSKKNLYVEVWRASFDLAKAAFPIESDPALPPEQRLRHFIDAFMRRIFAADAVGRLPRLKVLELSNPTESLEELFDLAIKPTGTVLRDILREMIGPKPKDIEIRICGLSIIGQCMFFAMSQKAMVRLTAKENFSPPDVQALIDHINRFTLAGVQAVAAAQQEPT